MVASVGASRDARNLHDRLVVRECRADRLAPVVVQQVEQVLDIGEYRDSRMPEEGRNLLLQVQVDLGEPLVVERVPRRDLAPIFAKVGRVDQILDRRGSRRTELVDLKVHKHNGELSAPGEKIHPNVFPGLNIDHLPYFVPIVAVAKGRTLIHDWTHSYNPLIAFALVGVVLGMIPFLVVPALRR